MPKRLVSATPAPRTWPSPVRLVLSGIGGLALAVAALIYTQAIVGAKSRPSVVLAIYPGFEPAATRLADKLLGQARLQPTGKDAARIRELAISALKAAPLSPKALRQLALATRDEDAQNRLVQLSIDLSRRDILALLLHAQHRLKVKDAKGGMRDLDSALRVSRRAGPLIFPMLLDGSRDPLVRRQLRILLARQPEWSERMVAWSIDNPTHLPQLAPLLSALPKGAPALASGYGQQIVDSLSTQRQYEEAFIAYAAYSSNPPEIALLRREAFKPVDWAWIDDYDTSARPGDDDKTIQLHSDARRSGEVGRILTKIASGSYRLAISLFDGRGRGGQVRGEIRCLGRQAERVIAARAVPVGSGALVLEFFLPAENCEHQWVQLFLDSEQEATDVVVKRVFLTPTMADSRAPGA